MQEAGFLHGRLPGLRLVRARNGRRRFSRGAARRNSAQRIGVLEQPGSLHQREPYLTQRAQLEWRGLRCYLFSFRGGRVPRYPRGLLKPVDRRAQ